MNRAKQIEWCQSCKNRQLDMATGLICSITSKAASFNDNCEDFEVDYLVFKESELKLLNTELKKKRIEGELNHTNKLKRSKIAHGNLPKSWVISNSNLFVSKIIILLFIVGGIIGVVNELIFDADSRSMTNLIISIIPVLVLPIILAFIIKASKDRSPKITIDHEGITGPNNRKYLWELVNTYKLTNRDNGYLIIKPFQKEEEIISTKYLELSLRKLSHIIELYKENTNANIQPR